MAWLLDILYLLGLLFAAPVLAIKSLRTGKYRRDWSGRLGWVRPAIHQALAAGSSTPASRVLIHCVSVGELLSTRRLVHELRRRQPAIRIIISVTTDAGMERALAIYGGDGPGISIVRYPLDFSWAVRRFLNSLRPDLIVLTELETWPNFISAAARQGAAIRVINGRMTQRSFFRYRLVRPLMTVMFRRIECFGVQTPAIAARFIALGAPPDRVEVIPTLKFDAADFAVAVPGAETMAAAVGIAAEHALLVGGSIGPGEQKALLECYAALRGRWPELRLALAPRQPHVWSQAITDVRRYGYRPILRSERPEVGAAPATPLSSDEVFVLDAMGELKKLYSLARIVFSGRSLVKLGGSDMIEAAALSKPCCFGPYTFNFEQVVELLLAADAAALVHDTAELTRQVERWLADPDAAAALGRRAAAALIAQRGATRRYAGQITARLATPAPQPR